MKPVEKRKILWHQKFSRQQLKMLLKYLNLKATIFIYSYLYNSHCAESSFKVIFPSSFVPLSFNFSSKSITSFLSILFFDRYSTVSRILFRKKSETSLGNNRRWSFRAMFLKLPNKAALTWKLFSSLNIFFPIFRKGASGFLIEFISRPKAMFPMTSCLNDTG